MRAYTMENIQDYIEGTKLIKNGTLGDFAIKINKQKLEHVPTDGSSWCLFCQRYEDVYFHASKYEIDGLPDGQAICEDCAEVYGCNCGCYPSMIYRGLQIIFDCELEKDDNEEWVLTEPFSNPAFNVFVKNGKVNLNSFIILELNEFIMYMRDKGMEVWD